MDGDRLPRKLAAILYADVVGYSRLTGDDEDATHRTLREYLDLVAHQIESHQGSVIHYAGDAVLARFDAVVDALSAATSIQDTLRARNEPLPEDRRVQFRIGVNLGDVIEDRGDIYGDGVNVAARLESLAEPGGICISGMVYDAIGNKLPLHYEYTGEQNVKNIERPVRTFRVTSGDSPAGIVAAAPGKGTRSIWIGSGAVLVAVAIAGIAILTRAPDKETETAGQTEAVTPEEPATTASIAEADSSPSIAVLPFNNLSNDPEQEYFSDGLTEDLITDLSRVSGLRVIARHSSFAYKGEGGDVSKIGRELGVRYVLEGSVRRSGDRLRINAQLINAADGMHIWAERYDRKLTDVFELQDEVTETIVSALAVSLTSEEERFFARVKTVDPDAYDAFLRGLEHLHRFTKEDNALAREYFLEAVTIDPNFARAHGNLGLTHARDVIWGWGTESQESIRLASKFIDRAERLDPTDSRVYFARNTVFSAQRLYSEALEAAHRAIELEPNYADGYGTVAFIRMHQGELEQALSAIHRAKALNPRYPFVYSWIEGQIYLLSKEYEKAVPLFREVLDRNPAFAFGRLSLIACYGQLGRVEDAAWEIDELLAIRPDYSLAIAREELLYEREQDVETMIQGLRKAGIPE